jgi:cobalt/nickel transport system permease protein
MKYAGLAAHRVMHIPDGYLSPSTCAVMYAAAIAGWYSALRRLKRVLLSRLVPLISVFAAFSFVVMMFNLPLPGGTTGHALGVTISAIVLGPAGAILAISIALAIQALFFGDGGISTLGANCFNMAIVAPLVAYASYRLIAAGAAIAARRRVVAAAISGYLAVNAAALIAAIEFGIQPALFHNARGMPLYAPYPFSIAVPAMMIGHLTLAGLAEAAISAGLVAYLQATDPALLRNTAGLLPDTDAAPAIAPAATNSLRRLWMAVALLMVLTPLGILTAGKAWGEWSPSELAKRQRQSQTAAASSDAAQSPGIPTGMQRLSSLWTAPFPAYAPTFVKSRRFGYFLSAMFTVGIVLLLSLAMQHYVQRRREAGHS